MPNRDRTLVDRHAPKNCVGWLMNDQEGEVCSFTNANPTAHAQWVVAEYQTIAWQWPARGQTDAQAQRHRGMGNDPEVRHLEAVSSQVVKSAQCFAASLSDCLLKAGNSNE
ncbi:hypothetical protein [Synechococcus sp. UW179A]|uniref:hypothetical protein n=1 Tax=Synechococcus sp. UW179A TaxID=2575510 RepID=UPI001FCACBD1|nr:hypothetical protein [Synechococcus sp. UW179A]